MSGPSLTYTEAVLEVPVALEGDELKCLYYLVDSLNRSIGWLDLYDGSEVGWFIGGIPSTEYLCEPLFTILCYAPVHYFLFQITILRNSIGSM